MAHLSLHDRKVDTIFHLLGKTADGMTKSLGWCLSQVPSSLDRLGGALGTPDLSAHNAFVKLQEYHNLEPGSPILRSTRTANLQDSPLVTTRPRFEVPQLRIPTVHPDTLDVA